MAGFSSTYRRIAQPNWLGQEYSADILIPGGFKLNPAAFPAPVAPQTKKSLQSGMLVGRTLAERDSGAPMEPYATGDEEWGIVAFDVEDITVEPECQIVRNNVLIKENWLPGFAAYPAPLKALIRAKYQCLIGAPSVANPYV